MDMGDIQKWVGNSITTEEHIAPNLIPNFRATLEQNAFDGDADIAPLGLHWCLGGPWVPISQLAPDGLPLRDPLRPAVPLPLRMAAGGDITFHGDLPVQGKVMCRSRIESIELKEGRSGQLCFMTISDSYETGQGLALVENRVVVYRDNPKPGTPTSPPPPKPATKASRTWDVTPSTVLLFRFSALTGNAHLIHYDEPYARTAEGYDGLLVHGPLQATLLLNFAAQAGGRRPDRFSYRAMSPMIARGQVRFCAGENTDGTITLWSEDADGKPCMSAKASWT